MTGGPTDPADRLTLARDERGRPVVLRPGDEPLPILQVLGIGRNYAEHATEQGADVPDRPLVFTKNLNAVCFHGDDVIIPRVCTDRALAGGEFDGEREQVDYEGELAVVLGDDCFDIPEADVLAPGGPVLGYCCANDVSARWWQKKGAGGQFWRGKSFDTFCPLGPWVVPARLIPDPQALRLETRVGDVEIRTLQSDTTASMIFPVATLVSELSRGTTLPAGTVILTGTPSGVGMARDPQRFLRDSDIVEVEIEGIGVLRNRVKGGIDCGVADELELGRGP